jgi:hypothetical protein
LMVPTASRYSGGILQCTRIVQEFLMHAQHITPRWRSQMSKRCKSPGFDFLTHQRVVLFWGLYPINWGIIQVGKMLKWCISYSHLYFSLIRCVTPYPMPCFCRPGKVWHLSPQIQPKIDGISSHDTLSVAAEPFHVLHMDPMSDVSMCNQLGSFCFFHDPTPPHIHHICVLHLQLLILSNSHHFSSNAITHCG